VTTGFEVRRLDAPFPAPVVCIGVGLEGLMFGRRAFTLLIMPCCAVICRVRMSCDGPLDAMGDGRDDVPGPGTPMERLAPLNKQNIVNRSAHVSVQKTYLSFAIPVEDTLTGNGMEPLREGKGGCLIGAEEGVIAPPCEIADARRCTGFGPIC
jgi:hypothetical protein